MRTMNTPPGLWGTVASVALPAVVLVVLVLLATPGPQSAVAQQPETFDDVPAGHTFETEISWLASTGITLGRSDGTFGLNDPVTRGAMAAFLYRYGGEPDGPFGEPDFDDVPADHTFAEAIAWLASTGITQGRGDGTFGLNDPVTRGAMAAFLYRYDGEPAGPFDAPAFDDVPAGHVFADEVAWLATTGITLGRGDATFGSGDAVTRGAMAAFLYRYDARIGSEGQDDGTVIEVQWAEEPLRVTVVRSSASTVEVRARLTAPVDAAELLFQDDLAELIGQSSLQLGDLDDGEFVVPFVVNAPRQAPTDGPILGQLALSTADGSIGRPLPIEVEVIERAEAEVLTQPLAVSSARVIDTEIGSLVGDELLVAVDGDAGTARQVAQDHGFRLVGSSPGTGLYQLQAQEEFVDLAALHAQAVALRGDTRVRSAAANLLLDLHQAATLPDDRMWQDAWRNAPREDNTWHLEAINAPAAWQLHTGSSEVTVAILDADFDLRHEDLSFTSVEGSARLLWREGHGTHVAGLACATGNNGRGVTGVAWECDLRGYNVGTVVPNPTTGELTIAIASIDAAHMMVRAAQDGARVANLSFGTGLECHELYTMDDIQRQELLAAEQTYRDAVRDAANHGDVLWVTSAGNAGCAAPEYLPSALAADLDNVLSVAATNRTGERANFSNYAPQTTMLAAPGGETTGLVGTTLEDFVHGVLSSDACRQVTVGGVCQAYTPMAGTSMAAPLVTGTAALMFSANPDLSAAQARSCLIQSGETRPVQPSREGVDHAFGIVDARAAVQCAVDLATPPPPSEVLAPDADTGTVTPQTEMIGHGGSQFRLVVSGCPAPRDGYEGVLRVEEQPDLGSMIALWEQGGWDPEFGIEVFAGPPLGFSGNGSILVACLERPTDPAVGPDLVVRTFDPLPFTSVGPVPVADLDPQVAIPGGTITLDLSRMCDDRHTRASVQLKGWSRMDVLRWTNEPFHWDWHAPNERVEITVPENIESLPLGATRVILVPDQFGQQPSADVDVQVSCESRVRRDRFVSRAVPIEPADG